MSNIRALKPARLPTTLPTITPVLEWSADVAVVPLLFGVMTADEVGLNSSDCDEVLLVLSLTVDACDFEGKTVKISFFEPHTYSTLLADG